MDKNPTTSIEEIPVDENTEIVEAKQQVEKRYHNTPKYMRWEELFFDANNKLTFGNAVQSACIAYDLDPKDPKSYSVAGVIGHKNIKKVKDLRKRYWEKKGMTHSKLLDLYNDMMIERKDVNLLYSVAEDIGVELPAYKQIITANKFGAGPNQFNAQDMQVVFGPIQKK